MIKDAELVAVFGIRGGGKSTITKALIKGRPKVVVFDPQDEYGRGRGWVAAKSRRAVLDAMKRNWKRGFRIAYDPGEGDHIEALHYLSKLCWQAQAPYDAGTDERKLTLVIEEANTSMPNHALPSDRNAILRVINQGRHVGIEAIAVSQRPANVSGHFRGNAARTYAFRLPNPRDQQAIAEMTSRDVIETMRTLPSYHFVLVESGLYRTGQTFKNGSFKLA